MTNRLTVWALRRAAKDESGQGLAEYGLIIALVALACIVALGVLGDALANSPGFQLFD
ncbi:MAG TPA: hypothetical protein PJ994_14100 [Tepidiformaceae bacterium]|nr:hypothetical protein [Tepidiformaceae bacterium]HMO97118.1 hypothetical protein [Tepidiformaceae bacterium]